MHRQLVAVTLWLGALASTVRAQQADRLVFGQGTVLVVADSSTGLNIWAARRAAPGRRRAPDFVGWFDPRLVLAWLPTARNLIQAPPPDTTGLETHPLQAIDGGFITVAALREAVDTAHPIVLTFGHMSERARWILPLERREAPLFLATLEGNASRSLLHPPPDVAYVNPTNRAATPDRDPGSIPPTFHVTSWRRGSGAKSGPGSISAGTER